MPNTIPRDPAFDSTFAMLREGYAFIWNRCRQFRSDLFLTRVMGQSAVCIHGREAAEIFYDERRFQRRRAVPRRVVTSLFGKNAVHTLDGDAHRVRKAAFLSLMSPEALARLDEIARHEWTRAVWSWEAAPFVVLFDESQRILMRAICAWAAVPLRDDEVALRARDFGMMVDAFGGVGPRLWRGKAARMRAEKWIRSLILAVRHGAITPEAGSALEVMAQLRDRLGRLLDAGTAAVELINVLRPTVAISWFIAFAALALHEHPDWRERLARGEDADLFVQEVRRFYPFAPYLGAKVREPFEWNGCRFQRGMLVLLDVYGTDHDPRTWEAPEEFRPERFRGRGDEPFGFIPQGGGGPMGHRCPGEAITLNQLTLALEVLTRWITYEVPAQDLGYPLNRMPTSPRSGFVLRNVRPGAIAGTTATRDTDAAMTT